VRAVKVSIINESLEDDGIFDIQEAFEKGTSWLHRRLPTLTLSFLPFYFFWWGDKATALYQIGHGLPKHPRNAGKESNTKKQKKTTDKLTLAYVRV
jgi:hypothetical protein